MCIVLFQLNFQPHSLLFFVCLTCIVTQLSINPYRSFFCKNFKHKTHTVSTRAHQSYTVISEIFTLFSFFFDCFFFLLFAKINWTCSMLQHAMERVFEIGWKLKKETSTYPLILFLRLTFEKESKNKRVQNSVTKCVQYVKCKYRKRLLI